MEPEIRILDKKNNTGIGYVSMSPVVWQRKEDSDLALYKAGCGLIVTVESGQYRCIDWEWKKLGPDSEAKDSFIPFYESDLTGLLIDNQEARNEEARRIVAVVCYPYGCPQCSHNYSDKRCTCEMFYLTEEEFRKVDLYRAEFRLSYKKSGYYPAELP
jgi:hypothetical protein